MKRMLALALSMWLIGSSLSNAQVRWVTPLKDVDIDSRSTLTKTISNDILDYIYMNKPLDARCVYSSREEKHEIQQIIMNLHRFHRYGLLVYDDVDNSQLIVYVRKIQSPEAYRFLVNSIKYVRDDEGKIKYPPNVFEKYYAKDVAAEIKKYNYIQNIYFSAIKSMIKGDYTEIRFTDFPQLEVFKEVVENE